MQRRVYLAGLGSAALSGIAGCAALGDSEREPCSGDGCDVGMTRNAFVPEEYEVGVGETVVWRNTSSSDHTVTAYEDAVPEEADYFASGGYESEREARGAWDRGRGGFGPRETYEHTFDVPGTYGYLCIPHEAGGMVGTIVVTE